MSEFSERSTEDLQKELARLQRNMANHRYPPQALDDDPRPQRERDLLRVLWERGDTSFSNYQEGVPPTTPVESPPDPDTQKLVEGLGGSYDDGHDFGWKARAKANAPADPEAPPEPGIEFQPWSPEPVIESPPDGPTPEPESVPVSSGHFVDGDGPFAPVIAPLPPLDDPAPRHNEGWRDWRVIGVVAVILVVLLVVVVTILVSGGSSTKPTATGTAGDTPAAVAPAATVKIADNQDRFLADPCGRGPLHLHWVVIGSHPGDAVVVQLTGPGLPAQQTFTVAADGSFGEDVATGGTGVYTTQVVTIAGQPAPVGNSTNSASVTGCPTR